MKTKHVSNLQLTNANVNGSKQQLSFFSGKDANKSNSILRYKLSRARIHLIDVLKNKLKKESSIFSKDYDPFELMEIKVRETLIEKKEIPFYPMKDIDTELERIEFNRIIREYIDSMTKRYAEVILGIFKKSPKGISKQTDRVHGNEITPIYGKELKSETIRTFTNKTLSKLEQTKIIKVIRNKKFHPKKELWFFEKLIIIPENIKRYITFSLNDNLTEIQAIINKRKNFFNGICPYKKKLSENERKIKEVTESLGIEGETYELYKFPIDVVMTALGKIDKKRMFLDSYNYSEMFKSNFETKFKMKPNFKYIITNPVKWIKTICESLTKGTFSSPYIY